MIRLRLPILFASLFVFLSAPAAPLEVVYVVRHAQKVESWDADDRLWPLSLKGAECAEKLAGLLEGRGIAAVYATERARTLATGTVVSGKSPEVEIIGDDASGDPSDAWVDELRDRHRDDEAILIVGHSNTDDDLVLAFCPEAASVFYQPVVYQPGSQISSSSSTKPGSSGSPETEAGSSRISASASGR